MYVTRSPHSFVETVLIDEILDLNPGVTREALLTGIPGVNQSTAAAEINGLEWEGDEIINWNLRKLGLAQLPESFGSLRIYGDLVLHENAFESIPESFCGIYVGGTLDFRKCRLSTLPDNFGDIRVRGAILMNDNNLVSLPESIGALEVSRRLDFSRNMLKSIPESAGSITAGAMLLHNLSLIHI